MHCSPPLSRTFPAQPPNHALPAHAHPTPQQPMPTQPRTPTRAQVLLNNREKLLKYLADFQSDRGAT